MHAFGPGHEHAFADVFKRRVLRHGLAHQWADIGHSVADGLHQLLLLLGLDAQSGGDELLQILARQPCFFAHELNAWRIVPKAGVNAGGEQVVGGR